MTGASLKPLKRPVVKKNQRYFWHFLWFAIVLPVQMNLESQVRYKNETTLVPEPEKIPILQYWGRPHSLYQDVAFLRHILWFAVAVPVQVNPGSQVTAGKDSMRARRKA